jgi:DNA ligase-4
MQTEQENSEVSQAFYCTAKLILTVNTSVLTTFYLGVLTNLDQVKARIETPHFEILFRASYGMDRSQLEVYNENIRMGRWRSKPFDRDDPLKRVWHHLSDGLMG